MTNSQPMPNLENPPALILVKPGTRGQKACIEIGASILRALDNAEYVVVKLSQEETDYEWI